MKRKIIGLCVGLLTFAMLAGCGAKVEEVPEKEGEAVKVVNLTAQNDTDICIDYEILGYEPVQKFSYELFKQNIEADNPVLSPVSAYLALALTGVGAQGETLEEFQEVLADLECIPNDLMTNLPREEEGMRITLANSAWIDNRLTAKTDWLAVADSIYKAEVFQTQLASQDTMQDMNHWVSEKTEGLIPTLLSEPLDEMARLALLNTIYFKGEWKREFLESATAEREFTLADGTVEMVEMMQQMDKNQLYVKNDVAEGVILPYKDESMALVALKPADGKSVREMYEQLTIEEIHGFLEQEETTLCNLRLPKFEIEFSKNLNDSLQAMGLEAAFVEGKADFSGLGTLDTEEGLYIDLVFQKAVVIVDEQGTEAAAVTAVMMNTTACITDRQLPIDIYFDEPFLYMIMDRVREVPLFIGIMDNPNA
ncbi:MAG: serpin family protein [Lachnospiraceae bacterium]|nr:serpin family protein [Lachnospiraceae bacterium]